MRGRLRVVGRDLDSDAFEHRAAKLQFLLAPHRQYEGAIAAFGQFEVTAAAAAATAAAAAKVGAAAPAQSGDDGDQAFSFKAEDEDDEGPQVACLMIIGPSGTGKSGVLRAIRRRPDLAKQLGGLDGNVVPVVRINVPDNPTPMEVVRELCAKVGAPAPKQWTRGEVSRALKSLFAGLGTRYLQMDEAHAFVQFLTARQVTINARFLKFLLVEVGVPIILAGEEPLEDLLDHSVLKRRTDAPIRLLPYAWGSFDDIQEFMGIAGTLATQLGYAGAGVACDPGQAMAFYCDTGGIIGLMAKRLVEAARQARSAGSSTLEREHFSAAWRNWLKGSGAVARDPFDILETSANSSDHDPYGVDDARFRALWLERFHPQATGSETSRLTRRRSNRSQPANRGFAR